MKDNDNYNKHYRNVRRETRNPAILNDVITNGLEHPAQNEGEMGQKAYSQVQEVARDNIDGKKWQNFDD